jgi:hypothetical protein
MNNDRHVIKFEYDNGERLINPIAWCGHKINEFYFNDAQHLALNCDKGGSIKPCKKCIKKIITSLKLYA